MTDVALAGAIMFTLLPPLLMAYSVPVHTREDTLAYILLILGLLAVIHNNVSMIIITVLLGVLCRETLLLLPFVNLFFNKKQNIRLRLLVALMAFLLFFYIRASFDITEYDHLEGLRWNLKNYLQVIVFGYAAFGVLWFPFFINFFKKKENGTDISLLINSSAPVFALIVVTTFIGGIFNEIRLLYLFAPWIIVAALSFYLKNRTFIQSVINEKKYLLFAGTTFLLAIILAYYSISYLPKSLGSDKYDIPYKAWIIIFIIQGYLGVLGLPLLFRYFKLKPFTQRF